MQREAATRPFTPRRLFAVAAVLLLLYALNIVLGMLAVKAGLGRSRLGDVGEFLLVLACMAFFVAGLIVGEEEKATTGRGGESDSNTIHGGMR